jgi:hypothetical protein
LELAVKELLDEEERDRRRRRLPVLQMPATRAECANVPRPCPHTRCVHNNYLAVSSVARGRTVIKRVHPGREPWEMDPRRSCDLDMAEAGPSMVMTIADVLNMTDERVRQIYVDALKKLRQSAPELADALGALLPESGRGRDE